MDEIVRSSVCWPTPQQEVLLQAVLGDRDCAIPAWERFEAEAGLDHLDEGSFRLLPQVYRNLAQHGYTGSMMGRLKGIYRQSWCRNQLLFHEMAPVMRSLREAGIPTMLLKGAGLSLAVYQDRGVRPMRDLDLLVPAEQVNAALAMLAKQGWRSTMGYAMSLTPAKQRYRHAIELVNDSGKRLDLHWHLLYHSRSNSADVEFWKRAVPVSLNEEVSQVLPPTLQLLHTCAHGLEGNDISPVRWVCDAMASIRSGPIDWEHLIGAAHRHDIVLQLRDALTYLGNAFGAPIPPEVLSRLRQFRVSRFAVMEYHRHLKPHVLHSPAVTVVATYRTYLRGVRDLSLARQLAGFPKYLAFSLRLPGAAHLPRQFATWLAVRWRAS